MINNNRNKTNKLQNYYNSRFLWILLINISLTAQSPAVTGKSGAFFLNYNEKLVSYQ